MSDAEKERAVALRRQGLSFRAIGRALGWPSASIWDSMRRSHPGLLDIGLRPGRRSDRPARAAALRDAGMTWSAITDALGYSELSSTQKAVKNWREQQGEARP